LIAFKFQELKGFVV